MPASSFVSRLRRTTSAAELDEQEPAMPPEASSSSGSNSILMAFPASERIDWSVVRPRRGEKFFALKHRVAVKIRCKNPSPVVMEAMCDLYVSDCRLVMIPERGRVVNGRQIDAVECELAGLEDECLAPVPSSPFREECVEFEVKEGFGRAGRFTLSCTHALDLFVLLLTLLLHVRFIPARQPHVLLLTDPAEIARMCAPPPARPPVRTAYYVPGSGELFLCEERPDAGGFCMPNLSRPYDALEFAEMAARLRLLSARKQAEEEEARLVSTAKLHRPRPARSASP
eukprot:tig00000073_g1705.t1